MLYLSYVIGISTSAFLGYYFEIETFLKVFFLRIRQAFHQVFLRHSTFEDKPPSSNDIAQMLDILVLCLSAGLSFDYALAMYCSKFDNKLSHDLNHALFSWQIGVTTRTEALSRLAGKYKNPSFERFVQCVVESLELGAPLAQTLESHADMIRQTRRHELESEIEKLPIKILIPLTTLILPAMLIAILGPIFSGLIR